MNYLFLSPYAVIQDWRYSEFLLQKSLNTKNNVAVIGCKGIMQNSCMAIKAHSNFYKSEFIKKRICSRCISNQRKYSEKLKIFYIEDFLEKKEIDQIKLKILNLKKNDFYKLNVDGLEIGKICLFENMLINKKNNLNFSDKEYEQIKFTIQNLLFLNEALKKIEKIYIPNIVISQNGNYSLSKLFNVYFDKKNIPAYSWEASNHYFKRFEKLFISKNDNNYGLNYIKNNWKNKFSKNKITKKNLESVNKHLETIIKAKALRSFSKKYSSSDKTLRSYYNIKTDKIVLLCSSSWDEVIGTYILKNKKISDLLIFDTQEIWIKKTIDFFKDKNDCTLIIRPHPRDYENKNSNVSQFIKSLNIHQNNVILNTPDHKLSLYSIFKDTNLVLNSWSTLGMESGIFNIPTLSISDELLLYPSEIEMYQKSENDYFFTINKFLKNEKLEFNLEQCKNFYNFLVSYVEHSSFHINLKKNVFFYIFSKTIDKLTLPIISTSLQKYFNGKNIDENKNKNTLNNFFLGNYSVLNELKNTSNDTIACDNDYIQLFQSLSAFVTSISEDNLLASKLRNIDLNKSRK